MHTKGPWFIGVTLNSFIYGDDKRTICENVWLDDNARLIAAAPDLLEACKKALAYFDPDNHSDLKVCITLDAAIKKATGE